MNENVEGYDNLSVNQEKAIELMLTGSKMEDIAKIIDVNINTLYRWRSNTLFKDRLNNRRDDLMESSFNRIKMLSSKSLNILENIIDKSDNENVKMKSAIFILDKLFFFYQDNISDRLSELELLIKAKER